LSGQRVFSGCRAARPAALRARALGGGTAAGMGGRSGGGRRLRHGDGRRLVAGRRQASAGCAVIRLLRSP